MIALKSISKSFAGRVALAPLDLTIATGRTTVLIGPSGCGKSTVIRLIVGLMTPDAGAVHFDGDVLSAINLSLLRQRIGYVVQGGGLFPHLTAEENISLMARWLGWPEKNVQSRLAKLADLTHFPTDGLNRYTTFRRAGSAGGPHARVDA